MLLGDYGLAEDFLGLSFIIAQQLMLSLFWYQILLLPIGKFDEEQKWWGKHSALTFSNKWIFIGNAVQWRRKVPKSGGGGAHRHVIYVPSVMNHYKRVVFGCMVPPLLNTELCVYLTNFYNLKWSFKI